MSATLIFLFDLVAIRLRQQRKKLQMIVNVRWLHASTGQSSFQGQLYRKGFQNGCADDPSGHAINPGAVKHNAFGNRRRLATMDCFKLTSGFEEATRRLQYVFNRWF